MPHDPEVSRRGLTQKLFDLNPANHRYACRRSPYGEEGNMVEFAKDGKSVLALSTLGRETTALVRLDVKTGEEIEEIAYNPKSNTGGVLLDDDTKEVLDSSHMALALLTSPLTSLRLASQVRAVSFNYARTERQFFDKDLEADFKKLEAAAPDGAEVTIASRTRDELTWVVAYRRDDGPTEYVIYEKTTGVITPLFVSQPALLEYKFAHSKPRGSNLDCTGAPALARLHWRACFSCACSLRSLLFDDSTIRALVCIVEDVRIKARDGLELVAYLTRADTEKPT